MSSFNNGTQILSLDFKAQGTALNINKIGYKINTTGIYSTPSANKVSNTEITVDPILAVIEDDANKVSVRVETSTLASCSVSSVNRRIVMRFVWIDVDANYADFIGIPIDSELDTDIIVADCRYSGATLTGFSYVHSDVVKPYADIYSLLDYASDFYSQTEPLYKLDGITPLDSSDYGKTWTSGGVRLHIGTTTSAYQYGITDTSANFTSTPQYSILLIGTNEYFLVKSIPNSQSIDVFYDASSSVPVGSGETYKVFTPIVEYTYTEYGWILKSSNNSFFLDMLHGWMGNLTSVIFSSKDIHTSANMYLTGASSSLNTTSGSINLTNGNLTLTNGTGTFKNLSVGTLATLQAISLTGNMTSTNGNITLTNGNITLTNGIITANSGTSSFNNLSMIGSLTSTNGNITLTNGNITLTNGNLISNNINSIDFDEMYRSMIRSASRNTWVNYGTGYTHAVKSIVFGTGGVVLYSEGRNVYRSTNYGRTFGTATVLDLGNVEIMSYSIATGTFIAPTTTGKVYRSTNNGVSWSEVQDLGQVCRTSTCINGIFLIGREDGNILRSINDGVLFTSAQDVGTAVYSFSNSITGGNNKVYAGTSSGRLLVSSNNGSTWTEVSTTSGGIIYGITNPTNASFQDYPPMAITTDGLVYISKNGGAWVVESDFSSTYTTLHSIVFSNGVYYIGTKEGTILSGTVCPDQDNIKWEAIPRVPYSGTTVYCQQLASGDGRVLGGYSAYGIHGPAIYDLF